MDSAGYASMEHEDRKNYVLAEFEKRWQAKTGTEQIPLDFSRTIVWSILYNASSEQNVASLSDILVDRVIVVNGGQQPEIITEPALDLVRDWATLEKLMKQYEAVSGHNVETNENIVYHCGYCKKELPVSKSEAEEVRGQQPFTRGAVKITQKAGGPIAAAVIGWYCTDKCAEMQRQQ